MSAPATPATIFHVTEGSRDLFVTYPPEDGIAPTGYMDAWSAIIYAATCHCLRTHTNTTNGSPFWTERRGHHLTLPMPNDSYARRISK